jgi:UDP-N-acetylglucosamine 1-carboxyvinyltransferase
MQPQAGVALALSEGTGTITESIFENRFRYVDELIRMGANIRVEGNTAFIEGVESFTGARIKAPDLRAGAALVLAGLAANGTTVIENVYFIERGYEDFDKKLERLGAKISFSNGKEETPRSKFKVV